MASGSGERGVIGDSGLGDGEESARGAGSEAEGLAQSTRGPSDAAPRVEAGRQPTRGLGSRPGEGEAKHIGAAFGAVVGCVIHVGFALLTGAAFGLLAVVIGITTGIGARLASGRRAPDVGITSVYWAVIGVLGCEVVFAFMYGVGGPTHYLYTLLFAALAGVAAHAVGRGVDLLDVITGNSWRRSGKRTAYAGTECPKCGSLQTEVGGYDEEREVPRTMVCNSCDAEWPVGS